MTTAPTATARRRPWRENVEALLMAIVVALLFKYFVLEISKIPSGSMQPTLMGHPPTGTFDRTLVDKLSYRFRDPERFEIVVFKHPLEESRIMVKRLIGMPGEELRIEHGDLFVRNGDGPWRNLRRPPAVMRAMWRSLSGRDPRLASWAVVRGGKEWNVDATSVRAHGAGAARFHEKGGPIKDGYADGYPRALVGKIAPLNPDPRVGGNPVGDLRLEGELVFEPGTSELAIELTEGLRLYRFVVPGPAAPAGAKASIQARDNLDREQHDAQGPELHLAAGERHAFALENLDDRLALELDGEELVALEIAPASNQESSLTVSLENGGVELSGLEVKRDIYYTAGGNRSTWSTVIPEGSYVMLGDNTQDSADGRLWESKTYTYQDGGTQHVARGNFRNGENPLFGRLPDGQAGTRLRDHFGEVLWFPSQAVEKVDGPRNEPLVARELILGRVLAVFWPIRPLQGLWRVGWTH